MFAALCDALALPAAVKDDPRFQSNALRCEHHAALKVLIEAALAPRGVEEWLAHLKPLGIPTGPMNDVAAVMRDPQVLARGSLLTLALPNGAPFLAAANPVRFAGEPPAPAMPAPSLDEHRSALLRELGL